MIVILGPIRNWSGGPVSHRLEGSQLGDDVDRNVLDVWDGTLYSLEGVFLLLDFQVQSFVFVMSKADDLYVEYLEDMYEDKRGLKKVRVRVVL
ncbi:hypothetical protein Bca52824_060269 [Brassica carinata]|uniref:Uncharacterized protein n=1 Tax=Brassica carinata TaxID=52824 RepID=A0A8X7QVQ4_BRACI|nr:hypothetical protein Bca52824_060269 [Brassica carinata]